MLNNRSLFLLFSKGIFILYLYSFVISGITRFYFLESVITFFVAVFSILYFVLINTKNKLRRNTFYSFLVFIIFVFFVLLFSLWYNESYFYFFSFTYELYKLSLMFFFLPMFLLFKYNKVNFVVKTLSIFMTINVIVLIAQYIFGVDILKYFAISHDLSHFASRNRPTGITHNANVIGVLSLFVYIFSNLTGIQKHDGAKYLSNISLISLLLSSSKASLSCFFLYLLLSKSSLKNIIFLFSFVVVTLSIIIKFNVYGIVDKFANYYNFANSLIGSSIISPGSVEGRLWGWYVAIILLGQSVVGYGLGTWGDFSSRINPYTSSMPLYEPYSDSALSHYLVEHGLFILIYLLSVYILFPSIKGKLAFFCVFLLLLATNYGFSQSLFVFGFWLILCGFKFSNNIGFYPKKGLVSVR